MKVTIDGRPNSSKQLQRVLNRHRTRILRPSAGETTARTTMYRTDVLQIPDEAFDSGGGLLEAMNGALAELGYQLVKPPRRQLPGFETHEAHFRTYVHRRVQLERTDGTAGESVDAWEALQALCRAATADSPLHAVVAKIELEHLLTAAGEGSLAAEDLHGDPSTEGHPATASFPWPGFGGRTLATVVACAPPRRRSRSEIGSRRPVIAVLDTGVGPHPWLFDPKDAKRDPFVLEDPRLQELLAANDQENAVAPLGGAGRATGAARTAGSDFGHGTFIAGIIRQACPDAQVLSIRIMEDDGAIPENRLLTALAGVLARVIEAESDPEKFIDVISLSAGYYLETEADEHYSSQLLTLLKELSDRGVLIVASAGNDATDRKCYPAALWSRGGQRPLVLSVGALDPDGNRALFSNYGDWVNCWAPGTSVISTVPVHGDLECGTPQAPEVGVTSSPPADRASAALDGFDGGFGLWAGTSFAAPIVAARLARALIEVAEQNAALSLDEVKQETARLRAVDAFTSCRAK